MIARIATFSVLVLLLSMLSVADAMAGGRQKGPGAASTSFSTPMRFVENRGQIVDQTGAPRRDIDFAVTSGDVTMFVGARGFHYQFARLETQADGSSEDRLGSAGEMSAAAGESLTTLYRVDVALEGARPTPRMRTEGATSGYENYYNVPGVAGGVLNVRSFERVVYEEVYPGIDWVLYIDGGRVKYDFVVRTGARVSDIRMRYAGANALLVEQGALRVTTPLGEIVEDAPTSWMEESGAKVDSRFVVEGDVVRFETDALPGAGTLVIDPSVLWSTYYGNDKKDFSTTVQITRANKIITAGSTESTSNIATTGAHQTTFAGYGDGFVAVFDYQGARLWATYYGGAQDDIFNDVDVDHASGLILLGGSTKSTVGIAFNGWKNAYTGSYYDGMVVCLDSTGVRVWASYVGAGQDDQLAAVACDQNGRVYFGGTTKSTSGIATPGAQQTVFGGGEDGFVGSANLNGTLNWATYLGGSTYDDVLSLAATLTDVFVAGRSKSANNIAQNALQPTYSDKYDGFVARYSALTGLRAWGTYVGGADEDEVYGIAVDDVGDIYIGGYSRTAGVFGLNGHQNTAGGGKDGFLSKYTGAGSRVWSTYYGGNSYDEVKAVAWASGYVYIAGYTKSSNNIAGAMSPSITIPRATYDGYEDIFVAGFNATTGARRWGTYWGGDKQDIAFGLAVAPEQTVVIAGQTKSTTGVSYNGFKNSMTGSYEEAFVTVFDDPIRPQISTGVSSTLLCLNGSVTIPYTVTKAPANAANIFTAQLSDASGSFASPTVLGTQAGTGSGSITVTLPTTLAQGTGYRVRVVASDPPTNGSNNGADIAINPPPTADITASGSTTICAGGSVTLSAPAGTGYAYQWKRNGTNITGATAQTYVATLAGGYTVRVTNTLTSCVTESASATTVVVNPAPTAAITVSGNTTFCDGGSVTLNAGTQTGVTYVWLRNGTPISGATANTYIATMSGSYTVTVTNSFGCAATSTAVPVTVNPLPVATITAGGSTTLCAGTSVVLSANSGSGFTYQWKRDGANISGATSMTYTASVAGAYTVKVTNGATSCFSESAPTSVVVNPLPTAAISAGGPTTFCDGASVVLSAGTQTGVSYEWKRNGTTIAGATASTYTATLGGSYTVVVTSTPTSCTATSAAVTVTVNPLPASTITASGPTTFCDGGSVTLSTPAASGQTYVWNRDGVAIPSATGSSYTTSIAGSYTVTVTNGFNCSSTTATPVIVTVNPLPTANVTAGGPTTFCDGGSVTLTASAGSGFTYQWLRNGSVIAGQTGASYTATTSGSYQVSVTSGLNCSVTSSAVVVTANPRPQAVISSNGAPIACEGSSVVLTTSAGSGYTYTWFVDGVEIAGAKSASFSASKTGSYTVRIATASGCDATSAAFRVTINPLPTADVTVTGPTQFCAGESVQFRAASGSGYKYQWLRNGSTIAGATSATYVASLAGQYAVVVTDANQCSNTSSAITVTVEQAPTAAIEPPATTRLCTGASVTLKAVEGAGFTYQWRLDGRNIDGATTSTLTVSSSGSYGLVVTNQFGCSSVSPLVRITNVPYPSATITVDGPTALCPGGTVTLRAPVGVSVRYQWSRDGQPITGASAMTLVVTDPGTYSVIVTNSDGCGTQSPNPVTVTVSDYPDAKVTALGQTRFCEGFSVVLQADTRTAARYQWYRNGVMIPFATSSQVVATEAGLYTVEVANAAGCTSTTDPAAGVFVDVYKFLNPTIMANGPTNLCEGDAVVISTPQLSGVTYQWMENGVMIPGATGTSITATRSGNYNVVVTTSNQCASTSAAVTVAVTPKPVATIAMPKELTFCEGSSLDLFVETDCCCLTYEWSLNGRVLSGRTGKSLTVTESGTYTLATRDMVTGCYSEPFSITVTAVKPEYATVSVSGPTQVCKGEVVTVTSTSVPGATYQWLRNGVVVPNATSTTLMVTSDGFYSMELRNSGGCTTVSNAVEVKYLLTPSIALGNIGPTTLCDGGSVTLVSDSGAGFVYQWMKDGAPIAGATSYSYTTNEKGIYSVMINAPSGCRVTTSSVEVRIVGIVNVGTVTGAAKGEVGKTSRFTVDTPIPGFLYSWQVTGGTILNGQTSPTIEVRWYAQGQQRVFVHATQFCSDTTALSLTIDPANPTTSVEGVAPESWSLYPNPAAGDVLLTIPEQARTRDLEVEVFSLLGASVHRERVAAGTATMQLRMSDLSVGMYRVTVRNDREVLMMKVLVKR